jgi:hypothetical protein
MPQFLKEAPGIFLISSSNRVKAIPDLYCLPTSNAVNFSAPAQHLK